jgi:hypothetical protein
MSSVVFKAGNETFHVPQVIYAGPVGQIPKDHRRNGSTHLFKMVTSVGATNCCYDSEETARKARSYLGHLLEAVKPNVIRHCNEVVDPRSIISFGEVVKFKQPQNGHTHAVVITLNTTDEKSCKVFFTYKSEDNAEKGRKALYAIIHAANGMVGEKEKPAVESTTASPNLPF